MYFYFRNAVFLCKYQNMTNGQQTRILKYKNCFKIKIYCKSHSLSIYGKLLLYIIRK